MFDHHGIVIVPGIPPVGIAPAEALPYTAAPAMAIIGVHERAGLRRPDASRRRKIQLTGPMAIIVLVDAEPQILCQGQIMIGEQGLRFVRVRLAYMFLRSIVQERLREY